MLENFASLLMGFQVVFDPQNIKHEKETTPKTKSEPKTKRINKKGALF